jgi:hypothetical protein
MVVSYLVALVVLVELVELAGCLAVLAGSDCAALVIVGDCGVATLESTLAILAQIVLKRFPFVSLKVPKPKRFLASTTVSNDSLRVRRQ